MDDAGLLHCASQPLGHSLAEIRFAVGENDSELLAAVSGWKFTRPPEGCFQYLPDSLQTLVATLVAEGVVVAFEEVYVGNQECDLAIVATGAANLVIQCSGKLPAIRESGQRIFKRLFAKERI